MVKPRLVLVRATRYFVIFENVLADHPMDRFRYYPKSGREYRSLAATA